LLRAGDLLVSTANSKALVGKSCLVGEPPFPSTFGAFVTVVRPSGDVLPSYLASAMRTPQAQHYAFTMSSNTTNISNLRVSDLMAFELPIPPIGEQRRISATLDLKLSVAKQLQTAITQSIAAISDLPATLLRQAFIGALTE